MIINLLTNASKFTKEGHIRLSFSVDEGKRLITLAISDTGIGVPKEKAEAVFERFVKLNQYVQGREVGRKDLARHFVYGGCEVYVLHSSDKGTERRFGGRPEIKIILCSMNDTLI